MMPLKCLKYLSNFRRRTLEMSLINCEINLILIRSENFVICNAVLNQETTFAISTQDNAKLLQQLKSGFKRKIDWNKGQSKITIQAQNWYLDYLIDPGVNKWHR